jgi:hypothetical protein
MAGTIWVYVKGEQKPTAENALVYAESGHSCSGTKSALVYKKEHVLPESDKQMVNIARKLAEEKGMKLQICDVSSRTGSLRARLAHVGKTPTMIVGNRRIVESITEEKLSSILERTRSPQPIDTH